MGNLSGSFRSVHASFQENSILSARRSARNATTLAPIGSYDTGQFDESAAEILAHHPEPQQQLLVVNALPGNIDLLNVADPTNPVPAGVIEAGDGNSSVVNVEPVGKLTEGSSTGSSLGVLGALAGLAAVVGAVFAVVPNTLPQLQAELQKLLRF